MSNNLNRLKAIVLEGGFDADDKQQVAKIEEQMQMVLMAEKLVENPVIQQYITYLKMQSENCSYLLNNDRTLTDLERDKLFEKRDLCDHFTKLFTGEQKASIENTINELLNVVQT